jgi:hypothetical protein
MTKKAKTKKKAHKNSNGSKQHSVIPSVPARKIVPLEEILNRVYVKEDLSTTCVRGCTCCRVACPQMKFSEATSIIDHIWQTWSKEDRKKILIGAIRYFFSDSLIKPCLMLDGQTCKIYSQRPLNCRLYGLWPADSWEARVDMFSKSTGLPREKLPLNTQCTQVRRKPQTCSVCNGTGQVEEIKCTNCDGTGKFNPPPLTIKQISNLFEMLDKTDMTLGVSELKVAESWNYRTFHDWILLKFWGDATLANWTAILFDTTPDQRLALLEAVEEQVNNIIV